MKRNTFCNVLCTQKNSKQDIDKFNKLIEEDYRVEWCVFIAVASTMAHILIYARRIYSHRSTYMRMHCV